MISDAGLKLVIAVVIGGAVYYKYSKTKIKQEKLTKDIRIGRQIPFEHGKPLKNPLRTFKQKAHTMLEPSYEFL